VGSDHDTLKVKVASIPGIRLQVYFMDSVKYFKRKGLELDKKTGEPFTDNPARALFFARAALHTAKRLGWSPEVVHASGWITAFVGQVLRNEWPGDPLFEHAKVVFTPDSPEIPVVLSAEDAESLGLPGEWAGRKLNEIGLATADAAIYADEASVGSLEGPVISGGDGPAMAEAGAAVYRTLAPERDLAA
jgi:starch synthase